MQIAFLRWISASAVAAPHSCGIWTSTGSHHAWHLRLRRLPQEAFRPLKQSHTGAQLSRTILEFILSVADRRATWLQVAQRSLLEAMRAALA